ncbi:TNT domain-containing protein [Pseudomonas cavernicola]|uniref:TNT domain-containing protein n=1 Tax=Pseudomonas cavernicola TaxID=2320866 RepID=UPI003B75B490
MVCPLLLSKLTPYGTTLSDETSSYGRFSQSYADRTYRGLNLNINERGLLAQERVQAEAAGWVKPDGSTWWPPYDGAIPGTQRTITYQPSPEGSPLILVDRYGETSGRYISPVGVPLDARALSNVPTSPPSVYSVDGVIEGVERANAAGWFDQRGTGIQDKLPGRVQYYLDTGKLGER